MPITRTAIVNDDGSGTTGTPIDNAWKQELYNQIDAFMAASVGSVPWTDVTFNAANFTGNGSMTWTVAAGDVVMNRYMILNKTLFWIVTINTSTVGGTPNTALQLTIPAGLTLAAANQNQAAAWVNDSGTIREARIGVVDGTHLGVFLNSGANWAAAADATYVHFSGFWQLV